MSHINEFKKLLYKQKPIAQLLYIRGGTAYYETTVIVEEGAVKIHKTLFFEVPVSDMGTTDFLPKMDGKSLIRWLVHKDDKEVNYDNYLKLISKLTEPDMFMLNENISESRLEPLTSEQFDELMNKNILFFLYVSDFINKYN